jgi:hypothetical protein
MALDINCYISSSLIQIIKFPKDDMKKCILTINILQFMYFVVNYFVPYDKWSGIHPVETASPKDYFDFMFNPDMIRNIVRNTNNYARWKMDQKGICPHEIKT